MVRAPVVAFVFAIASLLVSANGALANGRFPGAKNLAIGPGASADVLALQTTFGLVLSRDGGRSWRWSCEPAVGYNGTFDPTVFVASDGTVVSALPDGLSAAHGTYCQFDRPATAPTVQVGDLAGDPTGSVVAAVLAPVSSDNGISVSHDRGTSWQTMWTDPMLLIDSVEVAPGHPSRMYLSGYARGTAPALYRSTDGGGSFSETTRDLHGGYDIFISGVDPTNPDVVYIRSDTTAATQSGLATMLLRSSDGGATLTELIRTQSRMTGFAMSPDGRTLWVSGTGATDGVQRSVDGGATWQRVSHEFTPLCLRYAAGLLFACADSSTDGFAVACSTDGGEHFTPVLAFAGILGPDECPAGSPVHDLCVRPWPDLQTRLLADAGGPHPAVGSHGDASNDASDAVVALHDAAMTRFDAPTDANGPVVGGGANCACRSVGSKSSQMNGGIATLIALVRIAVGRRRARPTPHLPARKLPRPALLPTRPA